MTTTHGSHDTHGHASRRTRSGPPGPALALLCVLWVPLCEPATSRAQDVRRDFPSTNGHVLATAVSASGNTLYIGGDFTRLGHPVPAHGGGVLDGSTALPLEGALDVAGTVNAVAPDGAGGWYIGGNFTSVGGVPRSGLAQVRADRSVSPWDPEVIGSVSAIAVSGPIVYVGGAFTNVGGANRYSIAALDAGTGVATSWSPLAGGGSVFALAVSGSTVFVGGDFTYMGGQARSHLAALDGVTGLATTWQPAADGDVRTLATGGGYVFVGGNFSSIAGQARSCLAELSPNNTFPTAWDPSPNGPVEA